MRKVKLAIMYYSSTGSNYKISKWAAEAAESAGAEVKRLIFKEIAPKEAIEANEAWKKFRETEATLDELQWADCLIFSIPIRYSNPMVGVRTGYLMPYPLVGAAEARTGSPVATAQRSAAGPHQPNPV